VAAELDDRLELEREQAALLGDGLARVNLGGLGDALLLDPDVEEERLAARRVGFP
jgi:hypothetical protein